MTEETSFNVNLEQQQDYRFKPEFDWGNVAPLLLDSAPPLGHAAGPGAERILAEAMAYCLTTSLLFCTRKFKQSPGKPRTEVTGTLVRNERGRLRMGKLAARLHFGYLWNRLAAAAAIFSTAGSGQKPCDSTAKTGLNLLRKFSNAMIAASSTNSSSL